MKPGWEEASLGELCELYQPKTITKKEMTPDGPYPVFGANGIIGQYQEFNHADPQLMIGCRGACGTVNVSVSNSWITGNSMVVRPRNGRVALDFLRHFFHGPAKLETTVTGAAQPQITRQSLSPVRVPLPPLEEQRKIVAVLDEAFVGLARARENAEVNLKNARELSSTAVEAVFDRLPSSTAIEELQSLCTERGITYGVIKLGEHDPEGVPCLRTSNVRPLHIAVDGIKVIAPSLSNEYRRTILQGGEVLVNVRGTLGGVATVPDHMAGWNISREVAMVPVDQSRLDPDFASFFVSTRTAQAWLTGVIKGAAYKGINLTDLRLLKIPVPELKRQIEIVEEIVAIRLRTQEVERFYTAKLQDINDLRQSLMQKAFAGELT